MSETPCLDSIRQGVSHRLRDLGSGESLALPFASGNISNPRQLKRTSRFVSAKKFLFVWCAWIPLNQHSGGAYNGTHHKKGGMKMGGVWEKQNEEECL